MDNYWTLAASFPKNLFSVVSLNETRLCLAEKVIVHMESATLFRRGFLNFQSVGWASFHVDLVLL